MESIPVEWTDNAKRITALFTRLDQIKKVIEVYSVDQIITISYDESKHDPNYLRGRIGSLLAGKPVGDTWEILNHKL